MILNEVPMKQILTTAIALFLLQAGSACVGERSQKGWCDVTSLKELAAEPLRFAGKRFCGDAFILEQGRSIYVVNGFGERPSDDLSLLITSTSSDKLGQLQSKPEKFYIEARIDPMGECFAPPADNGEECSPYRRPVFLHLEAVRRH
jgi:hypothetical protein